MDSKIFIQLIFLSVVNISFTFSGAVLNTLVIVSLLKSSQLRKKLCNFTIMILSCFDLLAVVTNHPLLVVQLVLWLNERHDLSEKMKVYLRWANVFSGYSLYAVLIMNIERYLSVSYPVFHRKSVTKRMLSKVIAAIVILTTILVIVVRTGNGEEFSSQLAAIIFFVTYFPPFLFINYKLFKISRKMRKNNTVSPGKKFTTLKSISTCLLSVACLAMLYIPASMYMVLDKNPTSIKARLSYLWGTTIFTMNSTFNSLIFFWKNNVLRTEGKKVLKTAKQSLYRVCCGPLSDQLRVTR